MSKLETYNVSDSISASLPFLSLSFDEVMLEMIIDLQRHRSTPNFTPFRNSLSKKISEEQFLLYHNQQKCKRGLKQ